MNTIMVVPVVCLSRHMTVNKRGYFCISFIQFLLKFFINTDDVTPKALQEGLALYVILEISSMTSASGGCLGDKRR